MKQITNTILKALALAVVAFPMLTSCFNADEIWDKFDEIEHRLDSLENSLNEQFQALNSIIEGNAVITSCDKNNDGSYDITLSNGTKFTVLPEGADCSALVSVIEVNGVKCWATYSSNGKLTALTDDAGNPVPVVTDLQSKVEVVVEDGIYYLVIDGKRYQTGYDTEDLVQVFSSCTQLKDASGNVYAMQFTFGEGITVTVAVDGYKGVIFRIPNITGASEVVSEYFIGYGDTQSLLLDMAGVVDYIMQIPDGWRVAERTDEYTGEVYIDITAPAAKTIADGAAVAEGDLKVVAVVEGGKAAVTKLALSTSAFKTFEVNGSKAIVEPYKGVQKYVYGVMKKSEYDAAALLTKVSGLLKTTGDLPAGYAMAESAIDANHAETMGSSLENQTVYVFWAIPALYNEEGFYVKEGMFTTQEFTNVTVNFSKVTAGLYDADIEVSFNGVSHIYGGTVLYADGALNEVVRLVNNGALEAVKAPESYNGTASGFPSNGWNEGVEFVPGTKYITWVIPVQEGKTSYSINDVFYKEFTTKSLTSGSSIAVKFGDVKVNKTEISIPVSAENAEMIYYVYLTKTAGDRIASQDNKAKAEYIFDNNETVAVKASSVTAVAEKVAPNTAMWLYAVAVDKNGKYGTVNSVSATTEGLEYNSLSVTVTDLEVSSETAKFKVDVTGGEVSDFVYWFGKSSDDFWVNSKYLNGSQKNAQQYLALYPQDEHITKCMNTYGKVGADGTITFSGLDKKSEYIFVISAKDSKGLYSQAGYKLVVTLAANLGTIVREGSAQWNATKEQIKINWLLDKFVKGSGMGYSNFAFEYSGPTDHTAYIICASDEYFDIDSKFVDVENRIIEIEDVASKQRTLSEGIFYDENGDFLCEPDWIDKDGNVQSGGMVNVYSYYVHGSAKSGMAAYFAAGAHEQTCSEVKDGVCSNYQYCIDKLQAITSIDYYIEKFSGYYAMKGAEEAIKKAAQELCDFYYPYYKDKTPIIYENNGEALEFYQPYGIGPNEQGQVMDDVFVVLKDKQGNYYEPMKFEVPNEFKTMDR